jgi:hypothetical protein
VVAGSQRELTRSDIRMHGKACREWLDAEKASEVVELLLLHAKSDNPRVAISALDELLKCRALDIKEKELALKEQIADDAKRLRLIKQLAAIDPDELMRRARKLGVPIDGRAGLPSGVDGEEAS